MKTITYDENLWKLVPIMLTEEMQIEFESRTGFDRIYSHTAYKSMLSAAPPPPVTAQGQQVCSVSLPREEKPVHPDRLSIIEELDEETSIYDEIEHEDNVVISGSTLWKLRMTYLEILEENDVLDQAAHDKDIEMLSLKKQHSSNGWEPIECAPKDGTHILVNASNTSRCDVAEVYWGQSVYYKMGWVGHDCEGQFLLTTPTLWKPLDAPPAHLQSQKQAWGE